MIVHHTTNRLEQRSRNLRRAIVAVEFAAVLPFLAGLMIGIFELSRVFMVKQIVNDASRKACRTGILPGKANSDITSEVNNIFTDNGLNSADAQITIMVNDVVADASTAKQGDKISVKVGIAASKCAWTTGWVFVKSSMIESDFVVMMRQG